MFLCPILTLRLIQRLHVKCVNGKIIYVCRKLCVATFPTSEKKSIYAFIIQTQKKCRMSCQHNIALVKRLRCYALMGMIQHMQYLS